VAAIRSRVARRQPIQLLPLLQQLATRLFFSNAMSGLERVCAVECGEHALHHCNNCPGCCAH
jgi:hypothetical protein